MVHRVIIFKEKHADRIFPADTREEERRAKFVVMCDNNEMDYYSEPEKPVLRGDSIREGLTDEQIEALPEPLRSKKLEAIALNKKTDDYTLDAYCIEALDWKHLQKVLNTPIDKAITMQIGDPFERVNFVDWWMEGRKDYEYEYWEVIDLEEAK